MPQGLLPFMYQAESSSVGMTACGGLPLYMDLANAVGLPKIIAKHLNIKAGRRGWKDLQMIMSLIFLNLAGGESVSDLDGLNADEGFAKIIHRIEKHGLNKKERKLLKKRWRKERKRSIPSATAVFEYLHNFHNAEEETKRKTGTAFIPKPNKHLTAMNKINRDVVAFAQKKYPQTTATLDGDATLVETSKEQALYCYKKYKAFQPFNMYWYEQGLLVHSEFRDGNVPAGYEQKRLLEEALENLPAGVMKVRHRSDTAGYKEDLLSYMAEGKNKRFGVIEFAVGVKVYNGFKKAALEIPDKDWHPIYHGKENPVKTDQEWTEVCYVPEWAARKKDAPVYRFVAIREPLARQQELDGLDGAVQQKLPFPVCKFGEKGRYKLFGIVTNRYDLKGNEVVQWYRDRCGDSEAVHAVEKSDLAGGRLPSKRFGSNAAWWAIMILAYNLNAIMQQKILCKKQKVLRFKSIRYGLINLPGRVIEHARQLIIKVSGKHPSFDLLLNARKRIAELAHPPPRYARV